MIIFTGEMFKNRGTSKITTKQKRTVHKLVITDLGIEAANITKELIMLLLKYRIIIHTSG